MNARSAPQGFTMIEMLIVSVILITIMSVVIASYRTGQRSGELESSFQQTINALTTARAKSLGGEIFTGGPFVNEFPAGGYGVHFDEGSNQVTIYAADAPTTTLASGAVVGGGFINFADITVVDLCGFNQPVITDIPCGLGWTSIGASLEVVFSQANEATASYPIGSSSALFVGGLLEHQKTGSQSYFYIALPTGVVTGNFTL